MSIKHQRNGLIDIYKFILGFWVMFHHNFFFIERNDDIFSTAQLAVDFFFVISGYYLLRSMKKKEELPVGKGVWQIVRDRSKPLLFSICFITAFNLICTALFIRENILENLFNIFRYWWYVLYLLIAASVFYLLFRLIKSKPVFIVLLFVIAIGMAALDYYIETRPVVVYFYTFWTRTFGCMATGMLISFIPKLEFKKFNYSIPAIIILIPIIFYLAYRDKSFLTCILMIMLFTALVYFSSNITIGGRITDLFGRLGTRMYLYISFITTLYLLGLTHHRVLFVIDLALAVMDLILSEYKRRLELIKQNKDAT